MVFLACLPALPAEPLTLHPANPHYFLWRGRPTILVTSGEHYGAVLNLDFDYVKYLDTLAKDKLNLTRTFTGGAYVEPQGAFNIARNTLAPAPGRFICPWARSDQPGYAGGGNKFDLNRWDEAYFKRFRDFVVQASQRGIVVEVNLFCPMYGDSQWRLSPFQANNNINGLGRVGRDDLYTLDKHGGLLAVQEKMTRKLVDALRDFDNLYYEVMNEPYATGVGMAWQNHIVGVIEQAQAAHPYKKLISLNIANNSARVETSHPAVSIFNFHYATPPEAVAMNYPLRKVIGDNETGFRGTNDGPYRMEGWDFLLAGGGLYNNLDYSFAVGHEDGTFVYPASQPGGGNPGFRRQVRILREFMDGLDFVRMRPDNAIIRGGVPPGMMARALVHAEGACALYLRPFVITQFSVRWTGLIQAGQSAEYTFHTFSNDGVRLWINDEQVINNWTDHGETEDTGKIKLETGRRYPIKLEYFYNGGQSVIKLWWSTPTMQKQPIPTQALWMKDSRSHGLRGDYFQGNNFQQPWQTRTDPQVDFAWGTHPPFVTPTAQDRASLELELRPGTYQAEWTDPRTGQVVRGGDFQHGGGTHELALPPLPEDMALRLRRR